MKFKFLCLVLAVMMMLATLTSCSGGGKGLEDIANAAVRQTQTLVVYLMSEIEISEQTASDIEDAINSITKSDFKTQLDIHFFTEENYYAAIEAKFKGKENELKRIEREQIDKKKLEKELRESAKKAGVSYIAPTTPKPETVITEEATLVNEEFGTIEYVYPEPGANQLDIFYVGGYDKYMDYAYNEWLADLKEELTTTSKQLNEHINEVYMSNLDTDGIYGIPTNSVVGEYTWMLIDKELADYYMFNTEDAINGLLDTRNQVDANLMRFLAEIKANEPDVIPATGKVEPSNIYYWTVDPEANRLTNDLSVLCGSYDRDTVIDVDEYPEVMSLFHNSSYTAQMKAIKRMQENGYLSTETPASDARVAVQFVKGGYEIYAENQYDETTNPDGKYYIKMLERPRAEADDVFAHMLCVNALEDNVARAMEIVTSINIDPEVRNILQYGVKGTEGGEGGHYYIDENGVLHRNNNTYMMDINKTGNVFTAHPEEGLPANYWDYGIRQNTDALTVPVYKFNVEAENIDTEAIGRLQALYGEYMERMNACATEAELDEFFKTARNELAENTDYAFVRNMSYEPKDDDDAMPLYTLYWNWLNANKYISRD